MLPVILAHGYLGFSTIGPFSCFNLVKEMLAQCGVQDVHATDVNPKGSLKTRSEELAAQIRQLLPNGKVNVLAHSMGGMDAHYLIAHGGGRGFIQTLITLGSPFGGTLAADIAADPRKLARVSPASLPASIAEFVAATTLRWPLTAAADTHFAIAQLRQAVNGMATGDSACGGALSRIIVGHSELARRRSTPESVGTTLLDTPTIIIDMKPTVRA